MPVESTALIAIKSISLGANVGSGKSLSQSRLIMLRVLNDLPHLGRSLSRKPAPSAQ